MKKNTDHITFRNGFPFCENCGGTFKYELPISITMFSAISNSFIKEHKNCKKTWVEPTPEESLTEKEQMQFWLDNGERGISSETIFSVLGAPIRGQNRFDHPADPDDFKRCYKLLNTIPSWKNRLDEMKPISPVWNKLVDNWGKLTELLEEQLKTRKPNGMYEFMKGLGC